MQPKVSRHKPTAHTTFSRQVKKVVISAFIVLNVFTVLFMNTPMSLEKRTNTAINQSFGPHTAYRLRYASWRVQRYAHLVGLDNRWHMFGRQNRFNWWYVIKAQDENNRQVVLPLAMQTPRTFLENHLFDFKEAKFFLNIYNRPGQRQAYGQYLCRQFPRVDNASVISIMYEQYRQDLFKPEEAAKHGTHIASPPHHQVLQTVPCR